MPVSISQSGSSAFDAVDRDGNVLSSHSRQDKAIERVVNAGGGEVRTDQVLRVVVTGTDVLPSDLPFPLGA